MNILNFIESFDSNSNPADNLEKTGRREIFRQLGSYGKKLALGAIPFGAATVATSHKAFAAHEGIVDVLNFALLLEYLEKEFYIKGLDSGVIPAGEPEKIFMQISKHETAHVEFLKSAINSLKGNPIKKPSFDFTAGGMFMPFTDYSQFLILSQGFEDLGVRAYKGQAGNLIENDAILTAALQIHSVEARHASMVRRLRGLQGWILLNGLNAPEPIKPIYKGEAQFTQAGVELRQVTTVDPHEITEAFDEPMSKEDVAKLAGLFIAK